MKHARATTTYLVLTEEGYAFVMLIARDGKYYTEYWNIDPEDYPLP